jgi:D-sedoheptulose 7-phosphate isomerase
MIDTLTERYPDLSGCADSISEAHALLKTAFSGSSKLLVCGNGGSAADSEHIVGELMKGFRLRRPISAADRKRFVELFPEDGTAIADHLQGALPAIALTGAIALNTAFSNDVAPEMAFAQQVYGYGVAGDVLIGISTSGNSANVIRAAQVARMLRMKVIGLTGPSGGRLAQFCDVVIRAPGNETAEVQERHLPIYHALCAALEREFFSE